MTRDAWMTDASRKPVPGAALPDPGDRGAGLVAVLHGAAHHLDHPAANAGRHVGDPGRDRLGDDLQHPGDRRGDADDRLAGRPLRQPARDGLGILASRSRRSCAASRSRWRPWCCGASSRAGPARRSCRCRRPSCSTPFRAASTPWCCRSSAWPSAWPGDRPRARRLPGRGLQLALGVPHARAGRAGRLRGAAAHPAGERQARKSGSTGPGSWRSPPHGGGAAHPGARRAARLVRVDGDRRRVHRGGARLLRVRRALPHRQASVPQPAAAGRPQLCRSASCW